MLLHPTFIKHVTNLICILGKVNKALMKWRDTRNTRVALNKITFSIDSIATLRQKDPFNAPPCPLTVSHEYLIRIRLILPVEYQFVACIVIESFWFNKAWIGLTCIRSKSSRSWIFWYYFTWTWDQCCGGDWVSLKSLFWKLQKVLDFLIL